MQNKLKMSVLLVLLATIGFAQQNTKITKLHEKGTLPQNSSSDKTSGTAIQSNSPTAKTFDVAEGKKGLNAVNVRNAKSASPPASDSINTNLQSKHAINTKGTGATRDGAGKDK